MTTAAIAAPAAAHNAPRTSAFGQMSTEKFVGVLIEELRQQDPFNPQDSTALLEQLSSLRNIESQMDLQNQLRTLVLQNQVSAAGGMIGKVIQGRDTNNDPVTGRVSAVRVAEGKAILELDTGRTVPMDNVMKVSDMEQDLVGMAVEAQRGEQTVTGIVRNVHSAGGQAMLELDSGATVTIEQVKRIFDAAGLN